MSSIATTPVDVIIAIIVGYLIGSIPIANTVAKSRSVDLRTVGDGNPGFWNARETLGAKAALPIFVGDLAKGALASAIGLGLADDDVWGIAYVATAAAMVGHAYPVFAGFRGGRSVLTFAGGAAVFAPASVAISIGALAVVFIAIRSLAPAARAAFVALPFAQLLIDGPTRTAATGALMSLIGLRFAMAARSDRGHRAEVSRTAQE